MARVLTEADVIRTMREEYQARLSALGEQLDIVMHNPVGKQGELPMLSPELKVRHKKSQLRYTIDSVGPKDVILRTPEGDTFLVGGPTFEQNYELD